MSNYVRSDDEDMSSFTPAANKSVRQAEMSHCFLVQTYPTGVSLALIWRNDSSVGTLAQPDLGLKHCLWSNGRETSE